MKFEFDDNKSRTNKAKHGITLDQATQIWASPYVELKAKTVDEPRYMIIGKLDGKLYSCIYTHRGATTRLISARRSRKAEEGIYNEHIKK